MNETGEKKKKRFLIFLPLICAAVLLAATLLLNSKFAFSKIGRTMGGYYSFVQSQGCEVYESENIDEIEVSSDSIKIKLPIWRQSHDFSCGVACVASVMRYAGYDFDPREDRLIKALGASPENGTPPEAIVSFLEKTTINGDSVFNVELKCEMSLSELVCALDAGNAVICIIQAWAEDTAIYDNKESNEDGHYVVAVGYTKSGDGNVENLIFMDPSTSGAYAYIGAEEFEKRWHDEKTDGTLFDRCGIEIEYLFPEKTDSGEKIYKLN